MSKKMLKIIQPIYKQSKYLNNQWGEKRYTNKQKTYLWKDAKPYCSS